MPRGGTLIFSHILRLGLFFGVQNSEFQYFLGVFRKMNIFWGYEDFVDILGGGGSSQNWASLRDISMQFSIGSFLRSRYKIGIFFGVAKISNFFGGCLKFVIFLGG